jgi:hypothetical protein
MTAGTGLIMWLGELITERGIGNGMSLLIFTSIAAASRARSGPSSTSEGRWDVFCSSSRSALSSWRSSSSSSSRSGASRCSTPSAWSVGRCTAAPRRTSRSRSTWPASSRSSSRARCCTCRCSSPSSTRTQGGGDPGWVTWISNYLTKGDHPLYMLLYFLLIVFFTFFYVSITFNPDRGRRQHEAYGGFIPGIRAGDPPPSTSTTCSPASPFPGALYLGLISLIPLIAFVLGQREPELPVRRHVDPHHRRCRSGDGQADRGPAAAASLRRVPSVMRLHHSRPARGRQGHAGSRIAERFGIPAISTGDIFRANIANETELGQAGEGDHGERRLRSRRASPTRSSRPAAEADCEPGFLLDGYPRTAGQVEPLAAVFRERGLLVEVDGMGDVDEVSERIFAALER